ncbi:MAG: DUF4185 domain-containing protein [Myxococcales bacterium]|nr:DUF4185 domain-containing protein [Myxococcales bacterium]
MTAARTLLLPALLLSAALGSCSVDEEQLLVVAVRELGPTAMNEGIRAREGAHSAWVFGHTVWAFADTSLSTADAQGGLRRDSSWSHSQDRIASDGIAGFVTPQDSWGGPAEFLAFTSEELDFNLAQAAAGSRLSLRPLTLIDDPLRHRVLVFYAKSLDESAGTSPVGSSIAAWAQFDLSPTRPVLDADGEEPTLLFRAPEPMFGAAAASVDGESVYVWGCVDRQLDRPCWLAQVGLADAFDRQAWRFWTGSDWSSELTEAAIAFDGNPVLSIHRNHLLDRWLAIYADPESDAVLLRSAAAPTGPWSDESLLFRAEAGADGSLPRLALGHPDLTADGGRLEYVSYVRSTDGGGSELRLVELELAAP